MEKIIMVDGNNLLFRSYYATAYNGNFMKNSKGFPTNALFGFTNMINKIVLEEKPVYIIVAFDKGKTFRHEKYADYKAGRIEMPDELRMQFPIAKELLGYMGIKSYEIDNYEADDIIGTFSKYCDSKNYEGLIISSDKDLLQLINEDVSIKLLKTKDYIRYNPTTFKEDWGIEPKQIIDLKALMGDSSDNIPGVRGIGEKTAIKLLQEYGTLDNLYNNIGSIKGKMQEKLIEDKNNAYMSYELATINCEIPVEINLEDIKMQPKNSQKLNDIYEELEFYSFLKKEDKVATTKPIDVKILDNLDDIIIDEDCAIYLELDKTNYHTASIVGLALYNDKNSFYVKKDLVKEAILKISKVKKYTYDVKKTYVALKWAGIDLEDVSFDSMIAAYLLDLNVKEDIAYLGNQLDYDIPFDNKKVVLEDNIVAYNSINKAKFIFETVKYFEDLLFKEDLIDLYRNIELPLAIVLGNMEYNGVLIDKKTLSDMGDEIKIKIDILSRDIFNHAGCEFNISSPNQLGEILFDKLRLPHTKKTQKGYSTAIEVLNKLKDKHPIIDSIIEYRALTKLYSTYIEGLLNSVASDDRIHTMYTQTLTRTGRLSSIEPNLQNIPIRSEYGSLIRKAFVPAKGSVIISADYSQIELRVLAHMANLDSLKKAFKEGLDIHTKTASDIFHITPEEVTKNQRRVAKAVNFGIIYGISGFGLSENLDIPVSEAKHFIDTYLETYPGVKEYMTNTISEAHANGYVRTLLNRKRYIPELQNKNYMIRQSGERIALNTPIQGTSADIIKKAMVEIDSLLSKRFKAKMLLQVHDELIFECPKEELDELIKLVDYTMENIYELSVPLNVDVEYGDNWYQAK